MCDERDDSIDGAGRRASIATASVDDSPDGVRLSECNSFLLDDFLTLLRRIEPYARRCYSVESGGRRPITTKAEGRPMEQAKYEAPRVTEVEQIQAQMNEEHLKEYSGDPGYGS